MGGLLNRAEDLRGNISRDLVSEENGISPREKEEILDQLNRLVSHNRLSIDSDTFKLRPKKSAARLPLLINGIAAVIAIGAILVLFTLFNRQEDFLTEDANELQTTEGELLRVLKEESEKKISDKDREIASIKARLDEIESERTALKSGFEDRIRARESELRTELDRILAEERRKLLSDGLGEEEITRRLQELEASKSREFERQLEDLRTELAAEMRDKEEEITSLEAQFRRDLETAEDERRRLGAALAERERELQEQFESQRGIMEREKTAMSARLEEIQSIKEKEKLLLDQINGYYSAVAGEIDRNDYEAAAQTLNGLEEYLGDSSVASLPLIRERKQADLLVIDALRSFIDSELTRESSRKTAAEEAKNLLDSMISLIEEGDLLFSRQEIDRAEEKYIAAFREVPELIEGYSRLRELDEMDRNGRLQTAKEIITAGNSQFRLGNTSAALDRYREGLSLLELDAGTTELLVSTLTERERYERRIDQLENELDEYQSMRDAFAARIDGLKEGAGRISVQVSESADATLSNHLETKLTIKQLLDSGPVREEYPTLYEDAEEFFIALEEEKFEAGKAAALGDLVTLIEAIEEGFEEDPALASIWDKYDSPKQREELLQFVTALTALYN